MGLLSRCDHELIETPATDEYRRKFKLEKYYCRHCGMKFEQEE